MIKITEQKSGRLTEEDWLELGRLLFKAGYQVVRRKQKEAGKTVVKTSIEAVGDGGAAS